MTEVKLTINLLRAALVVSALAASSVSALATKIDIVINKVAQKMIVTIDGEKEYVWLISTGGQGYDTPSGTYRPFRFEKVYFSKEWDNAPMPNAMFFTARGHAIHGSFHTKRLGTRASHGCVRLAPENAALLFNLVTKAGGSNTTITVKGGFFDSGTQTANFSSKPSKPFVWPWDKKKPVVKVAIKKKKLKRKPIILGGQQS